MSKKRNKRRFVKPQPEPKESPKRNWDLILKVIQIIVWPIVGHLIHHFNQYADRLPL